MSGPLQAKALQVQERHSEGAFADRYVGLDTASGKQVLVSVPRLDPAETDPLLRERALEAVRRYAGLVHPHLCAQLGSGLTSSGQLWIAQELPDGAAEEAPASATQAAEAVTHVCEGLAYAHAQRLPHGTLTPDAILFGAGRSPRVADFGVGAALFELGLLAELAGRSGTVAPEVRAGAEPSLAADVYGLGATALQWLQSGEVLEAGTTPEALGEKARRLPAPALAATLERAVQRDPDTRFAGAEPMLQQLRAVIAPGGVVRPSRRRKPVPRAEPEAPAEPEMTWGHAFGLMAWALARNALNLLLGLALLTAAVAGGLVLAVRSTPRLVLVPAFEGKPVGYAVTTSEQRGLKAVVGRQEYDEKTPAGYVLEQTPYAGKTVRAGRTVELVVSLGPPRVKVPKVTGLPLPEAKGVLTAAELSLGAVNREVASGDPDVVLGQAPEAGKEVAVNSRVDLTIAATSAPAPPTEKADEPRAADLTITVPQGPVVQRVRVEVHYPSGRYTVAYERAHRPGEKVQVHVVASGDATVQTLIDGELVAEQNLEPPP